MAAAGDPPDPAPAFERHAPAEEFRIHVEGELNRLRTSDQDFDEDLYRRAVDLVLVRLRER